MIKSGILTISDSCYRGLRSDGSGQAIRELLDAELFNVNLYEVVPDERIVITGRLTSWALKVDLILTTGGTGLGRYDVTPEATLEVLDRQAPGLSELMRSESVRITPMAALSRAVAGTKGQCLIINLPGSPKAVVECLNVLLPLIPHAVETIHGPVEHHPVRDDTASAES